MKPIAVAFPILLALLSSCIRPSSEELYIRSDQRGRDGRFVFNVEVPDSNAVYSVSLLSLLDCGPHTFRDFDGLPLRLTWADSSGSQIKLRAVLDTLSVKRKFFYSKQLSDVVMEDFRPSSCGTWTLDIDVDETLIRKFGVRGFGLIMDQIQ